MKTLHIHIGTPKTATTALQFFCMENAGQLAKEGYCYPAFPFHYPGSNEFHNGSFLLGIIKDENGNRDTLQEEKNFREGMDIVKKNFLEYDHVILSHEGIWRRVDSEKKDFWDIMMREAKEGNFRIHVIVYLRRQDQYFLSNWNQRIKRLASGETIEEFTEQVDRERLDYYGKLKKLSAIVGKENITVRRFEKGRFEGGSIFSDFLSVFHLPLTEEYKFPGEARNTGLYGNTHEIKRVLNSLPQMEDRKQNRYMRDILRDCSKISGEKYPNEMWSKEEISAFLEEYRMDNEKVAEEYLNEPGTDLFDDTIADLPKWQKDNPYMTDDLIRFFGVAVLRLHQENLELKQQLKKQSENTELSFYKIKHPFWAFSQKIKKKSGSEK